jgi:two-component system sensor histidine kinase MtrB
VAGVAAATVGGGSYLLVKDARSDDFVERSLHDSEANYLTLTDNAEPVRMQDVEPLVRRLERRTADATVVISPFGEYASRRSLSRDRVPDDLLAAASGSEDEFPHQDVATNQGRFLVVATPESPSGTQLAFFYSRAGLEAGLRDLAAILWRLWLIVVIAAGLVGHALARRTLKPVSSASEAARSLAEGLLDTRLPIEREDEFGAWALSFNEMAEALETKISELIAAGDRERRFTSDVSHELRTPLTALVTSASMLEEKLPELEADTRWVAERTIAEARRLRNLVDELLEISKLQSGGESVRITDVDLGALVSNVIRNNGWEDAISQAPISVVVPTDKARVERIVANLVSNAVEHGRLGARVQVMENGDAALVVVRDEGLGIAPKDMDHLFERFYKADPSRAGGSGLGLAIAAENARLVGGRIEVTSPAGGGATFTLRLPRTAPKLLEADPPSPTDTRTLRG